MSELTNLKKYIKDKFINRGESEYGKNVRKVTGSNETSKEIYQKQWDSMSNAMKGVMKKTAKELPGLSATASNLFKAMYGSKKKK